MKNLATLCCCSRDEGQSSFLFPSLKKFVCYQSHFKCSVSSCPQYTEAITCQIKCRNRGNDSRCCLCICLTALPECLWEGGGGRGLRWVNPTAVREPLLLSPLSSHVVAVSSFLDVSLRDVRMSPCLLEFGL